MCVCVCVGGGGREGSCIKHCLGESGGMPLKEILMQSERQNHVLNCYIY